MKNNKVLSIINKFFKYKGFDLNAKISKINTKEVYK